jgi:hypothetical protein
MLIWFSWTQSFAAFYSSLDDFLPKDSWWYRQALRPDVCQIIRFLVAGSADMRDFTSVKGSFQVIIQILVCCHVVADGITTVHHLMDYEI